MAPLFSSSTTGADGAVTLRCELLRAPNISFRVR